VEWDGDGVKCGLFLSGKAFMVTLWSLWVGSALSSVLGLISGFSIVCQFTKPVNAQKWWDSKHDSGVVVDFVVLVLVPGICEKCKPGVVGGLNISVI